MSTVEFTELDKYDLFRSDSANAFTYSDTCKSSQLEQEKKLMLAILEDAVTCIKKFVEAPEDIKPRLLQGLKKKADEALEWIKTDNEEWIFSFENICYELKLNPEYLRKGIVSLFKAA